MNSFVQSACFKMLRLLGVVVFITGCVNHAPETTSRRDERLIADIIGDKISKITNAYESHELGEIIFDAVEERFEFFGRVVDEAGNPVTGVVFEVAVMRSDT